MWCLLKIAHYFSFALITHTHAHVFPSSVIYTDRVESKLAVAAKVGAMTLMTRGLESAEVVARVQELLGGPADISIDCTGVEDPVRVAVSVCIHLFWFAFVFSGLHWSFLCIILFWIGLTVLNALVFSGYVLMS